MFELETLRMVWWILLGFLFIGFALFDGFDLGTACLFPLVTKNEAERNAVLETIKPFWEGNQVWIIVGAGALFAAWPFVYAVAFSGAYFVMLLLLLTMGISRPVSFKYREKLPNYFWRRTWDWLVFVGGFVPALLFGILVGNILIGLPFRFDSDLSLTYEGKLYELFSLFPLLCGLASIAMLAMHGGAYLATKTYVPIKTRALFWTQFSGIVLIVCYATGGIMIANTVIGYQVTSVIDPNGYSNPLNKTVIQSLGAWLNNYSLHPSWMLNPLAGFLGAIGAVLFAFLKFPRLAFFASCISICGIIGSVGASMFPFILPSTTHFNSSLLVWDASSTKLTLMMMLVAIIIFMPIIMLYTAWVYRVLSGKIRVEEIKNKH
ncbi:MAG: cytochrome d ubiquinol oxidase subunit II [Gammaproteobacteria bacterium]|nr:cytochrome d ubiquinol oxidase subunit II [Gammaproteobacteria bacterium]